MADKKKSTKEAAPSAATFEIGGKTYRFRIPKYIDGLGNVKTAAEALESPAELERLVAIQSGVIEEVTNSKK